MPEKSSKYRRFFEHSRAGLALHTMVRDSAGNAIDYVFQEVNAAFYELTGLRPCVIGKRASEVVPGLPESGLVALYDHVVRSAAAQQLEVFVPSLQRRFDIMAFPIGGDEFAVSFLNITERWNSQLALRQSESQLRDLFELVPAGVMMIAKSGEILHMNRAAGEIVSLEAKLLRSAAEPTHHIVKEDGTQVQRGEMIWQECIRTGQAVRGAIRGMSPQPGGPVRWLMIHAEPVRDPDSGEVSSALISFQDITDRKRVQDILVATAKGVAAETGAGFLRSLVERLAEALNADHALIGEHIPGEGAGRIRCHALISEGEYSEGLEYAVSGAPCEVVLSAGVGCYPSRLRELFPHDEMAVQLGIESYVGMPLSDRLGRPLGLVAVMWKKELHEVPLANSLLKIFAARASAELERKRAEEALLRYTQELEAAREAERLTSLQLRQTILELAAARRKAEAASQVKSDFLATISHEIRTPLNAILGMADLLIDSGLEGQQRDDAQSISNAANLLLLLINDVLDFSKIESGRTILERIRFSLFEVIQKSVDMVRLDASRKELALIVEFDPGLPEMIYGDPARLHQVLINLLSNAVKFTHEGSVILRISVHEAHAGSATLHFDVTDTGIGVPRESQAGLFEPFVQADASTTRRFGGTGLGLAICRRLVLAMGGQIGLESDTGAGSTFWCRIPFDIAPDDHDRSSRPTVPSPTLRKGRILLAEDNPINRLVAVRMIEKIGCAVHVVHDGRQAVEAALRERYDLILLDCQMPEVDGYQAAREIRMQEASGHRNVIVALTASALPGVREKCLDAGMDDYISKPVSLAVLHGTLAKWLDTRGRVN
ncbi:MAG: response regulator [Bryobacterales bacterium]|nr:response regulator [Bryobacterales bacterium]